MSKDLQVEGLEAQAPATTPVEKKTKKEYTPEELASIKAAVGVVQSIGVSDKMNTVLTLASAWNDKDAKEAAKEVAKAAFGTAEAFKDYCDNEFATDIESLAGIAKLVSTLNNIKSFYARREATKKVKLVQVSIAGDLYDVNSEYFQSIKGESKEAKRELVLAHPDTKPSQEAVVEDL